MCGSITEKLHSVCASSSGFVPPCKSPPEDAAVVGTFEASEGFNPALLFLVGGLTGPAPVAAARVRSNGRAASCQPGGIMASMPGGRICTGERSTAAVASRERSFGTALPARCLATSSFHQISDCRAIACCGRGRVRGGRADTTCADTLGQQR